MQFEKYVREALSHKPTPAFVVLPEHGLLDMQRGQDPELRKLEALAHSSGSYICAAGDARVTNLQQPCPFDNLAVLIGPEGIILEQLKSVPIPFFRDGNPAVSQATAQTRYGTVGMLICYDATFTDLPRRLVQRGAELLLVPVMDPQEWPLQERRQHADLAIFRAIELRRCVVRAASSGISQIIDATGKVLHARTAEEGPGLLTGQVYFSQQRTLFVRGGWLFAPILCVALVAAVLVLTVLQYLPKHRGG